MSASFHSLELTIKDLDYGQNKSKKDKTVSENEKDRQRIGNSNIYRDKGTSVLYVDPCKLSLH